MNNNNADAAATKSVPMMLCEEQLCDLKYLLDLWQIILIPKYLSNT